MEPERRNYLLASLPSWLFVAIAAWVAVRRMDLAPWIAPALVALWILKDLLLYPAMRQFYRSDPAERRIVGEQGVALNALDPHGLVRVRGEIWQARADSGGRTVAEGARVRVHDIQGLLLVVAPEPPA